LPCNTLRVGGDNQDGLKRQSGWTMRGQPEGGRAIVG
jgi:hypothetical protein